MISDVILKVAAMEYAEEEEQAYRPRPSLAGPKRCIRQLVYMAQGKKRKALAGRAVVVFSDSKWQEDLVMDLLRKSAFQVHSEQMGVTMPGAFPWIPAGAWHCNVCDSDISNQDMHGHLDWLVSDILGRDYVVDLKALSHFGFEALWKGETPYDYLTQLAFYTRGLQIDSPVIVDGILLIKNKNQSGFMEFLYVYDTPTDTMRVIERVHHTGEREKMDLIIPNIVGGAIEKFAEVERHRVAGTLPDRQYTLDDWNCGYCSFSEECWSSWAAEHSKLTTDVVLEGNVVDMLKYEREVALHESSAKKERKELKDKIKKEFEARGVRSARVGDYIVNWSVTMQEEFDRELLLPGVAKAASKMVPVERFTIRKFIEKKGGTKR